MYKLLLCWRYLRTRYLALASIVSVMLGVATLIVVNSVMSGFATKLRERLRGLQADVLVEYRSSDGFFGYVLKMAKIKEQLGDRLVAISPVIESYAIVQFRAYGYGDWITRPVRLVGVDPATKAKVGDFSQYLQKYRERPEDCFTRPIAGVHVLGCRRVSEQQVREKLTLHPGQAYRPQLVQEHLTRLHETQWFHQVTADAYASPDGVQIVFSVVEDAPPRDGPAPPPPTPPNSPLEVFGAVVGYGIANYRDQTAGKDVAVLQPGDEITITTVSRLELAGHDDRRGYPRQVGATLVVTDIFKCEMSEYDSNLVFVDIHDLQRLRTMQHCATGLHLKLKDYDRDAKDVVRQLAHSKDFPPTMFEVNTWEDRQGALLAAINIERGILNVLLFLIIAVAGFGILAIFFMIVVEKTRDIGILKALGASNRGVMGIFLSYGLALGIVGAGLGTALGVAITLNINDIEKFIADVTGQEVFDRKVYYFDEIPTDLGVLSVVLVNAGAVAIAVAASVFPSLRAALLHPVRALRYE